MNASDKAKRKKDSKEKQSEMKWEELQNYRHVIETELQILVMKAAEMEEYADLKDYLQLLTEVDPSKLHKRDSMGMTALHCAVACKNFPTSSSQPTYILNSHTHMHKCKHLWAEQLICYHTWALSATRGHRVYRSLLKRRLSYHQAFHFWMDTYLLKQGIPNELNTEHWHREDPGLYIIFLKMKAFIKSFQLMMSSEDGLFRRYLLSQDGLFRRYFLQLKTHATCQQLHLWCRQFALFIKYYACLHNDYACLVLLKNIVTKHSFCHFYYQPFKSTHKFENIL
ncbi:hypothetical protein ACJMK2_015464 [Sinanodonta woodiana]|uniref:Uncharacterized protein n=1 Tax=Sinanodonta woodiana TaxID=1069815 RepID=A0ABD3UQG5_SINWO